jgi:hypothetical protein
VVTLYATAEKQAGHPKHSLQLILSLFLLSFLFLTAARPKKGCHHSFQSASLLPPLSQNVTIRLIWNAFPRAYPDFSEILQHIQMGTCYLSPQIHLLPTDFCCQVCSCSPHLYLQPRTVYWNKYLLVFTMSFTQNSVSSSLNYIFYPMPSFDFKKKKKREKEKKWKHKFPNGMKLHQSLLLNLNNWNSPLMLFSLSIPIFNQS